MTIAVHHAGKADGPNKSSRELIWCDITPTYLMRQLFNSVADGISGLEMVVPSTREGAHVELVITWGNPAAIAADFIGQVNEHFASMSEDKLTKMRYDHSELDAMAIDSTTSSYSNADSNG